MLDISNNCMKQITKYYKQFQQVPSPSVFYMTYWIVTLMITFYYVLKMLIQTFSNNFKHTVFHFLSYSKKTETVFDLKC